MELANKIRNDIFVELGSKEVQQSFCVEDLTGLGMGHLQLTDLLKAFTQIDKYNFLFRFIFFQDYLPLISDNYPNTLRKVVVVNVPTMFSLIWNAVQYFWDAKQVAKFQFIGNSISFLIYFPLFAH